MDNDLLVEGKRNLIDYFQEFRDITTRRYRLPAFCRPKGLILETVQYKISRGGRYKVANNTIAGNHYFKEDTNRERMYKQAASFTMRRGRYSEAFQRKDQGIIGDLYRANGFRDVVVKCVVDKNHAGKTEEIGVTVSIDEGPQWMVDNLSLVGVQQENSKKLTSQLASVARQPFSDVNLASDRAVVLTYYYENGFPSATFKATWAPSGTPQHVNVTYTVAEGNRQYVQRVITSGITSTRPSLLEKNITLHPGDPLSPRGGDRDSKRTCADLGILPRELDTTIQDPDGDTGHKYVIYNIEEASRYSLGIGFGLQAGRYGNLSGGKSVVPRRDKERERR